MEKQAKKTKKKKTDIISYLSNLIEVHCFMHLLKVLSIRKVDFWVSFLAHTDLSVFDMLGTRLKKHPFLQIGPL